MLASDLLPVESRLAPHTRVAQRGCNVFVNETPMKDDFVAEDFRAHDDWGPQVIPEGYYFVLGDHRNNSSDSRHWGFVPKRYIIGKVQVRWWPITTARVF